MELSDCKGQWVKMGQKKKNSTLTDGYHMYEAMEHARTSLWDWTELGTEVPVNKVCNIRWGLIIKSLESYLQGLKLIF